MSSLKVNAKSLAAKDICIVAVRSSFLNLSLVQCALYN